MINRFTIRFSMNGASHHSLPILCLSLRFLRVGFRESYSGQSTNSDRKCKKVDFTSRFFYVCRLASINKSPFLANVLRAKVILVPPWDKILFLVPIWHYYIYMKIIAIKTLRDFWLANPDAEQPLKAWVDEASKAEWKTPAEIKEQYRSASILKNRRVVFNIKGNDYRLIVAIAYQRGWMFIKFVGTHKEYDKIDAETVNLE